MFAIFKYSMRLWWDRKNKIRDKFLLLLFYIMHVPVVAVQFGPRVECCNE